MYDFTLILVVLLFFTLSQAKKVPKHLPALAVVISLSSGILRLFLLLTGRVIPQKAIKINAR